MIVWKLMSSWHQYIQLQFGYLPKKMLGIKIAFVGDRMKVFLFLPY